MVSEENAFENVDGRHTTDILDNGQNLTFPIVHMYIMIIPLFQGDNIFGTNASLTYGPQIQRHTCV